MLIRRCVYENTSKEDIPKLFPDEVLPELQKLLTLLLQKFQLEWQEDVMKDQNIVPRLKAMTWNMTNLEKGSADPAAVIDLKLQNVGPFQSGVQDVKFQLATDSIGMMLKTMHCIRDQFSTMVNIRLQLELLSRLDFIMSSLYVVRMRH
ncbi:protein FAR1-RELATED SEQUENCE 3-like isoform X1 [Vigna umbellata]|uniref:protein FAR1-RELATED SEQUENCE 3-like isoform X1 n=1 Tax=Vigna umbellata TaxID=87088 RepID=UPI001F5EE279|nr:protein FAR1-RELATED SEQUENCE 3-like isoform X1 [Vigna umbellata]